MQCGIPGRGGAASLEAVVHPAPNHAQLVQPLDLRRGQSPPRHCPCVQGPLVLNPAAQPKAVRGGIPGGHLQIAVGFPIGLGVCIAVLPAAFGGALPHHADGVQPGNLLLGQYPKPGSPAHGPLGLQPVAQGQIAVRPIPLGHVQMTVGLEIVPGLGVHHVPGSVQAGFQLLKQPAAVLHFVDQFKPGGMDLTFRMMIGVKGGQLVHLLTNGGNGVQILHIVDQIHNHGRAALEGAEGPANLLLIQNGRHGRAA